MPPVKKASGSKGPPQTVRKESMLGWIGKGLDVSIEAHSMKISSTHVQPFLTNASLNVEGPVLLKIRLRSAKTGKVNLQWRTADQKGFVAKGQSKQFTIKGGDWRIIEIKLPRPRNYSMLTSAEAFEYKRETIAILHEEAMKSFANTSKSDA